MPVPNTPPAIRSASHDDISVIGGLIRSAFRDVAERFGLTPENCPRHPSNCTDEWVVLALEKGAWFYVAEMDNRTCGCVMIEDAGDGIFYLGTLGVLPERRGKGLGTTLARHAIRQAKDLGAKRLDIGVIADHTELIEWYARLGFSVREERMSFEHLPFEVTSMFLQL